ncbi:MbtH family NRPS accessory protein [Kitasatospora sp. SUK 42]|uniref:MbtH family NRPS accessory protein n=1 Tax=Kitasatospora sp. SUK 42 TaxID=1588882 RepID=UPI0035ABE712
MAEGVGPRRSGVRRWFVTDVVGVPWVRIVGNVAPPSILPPHHEVKPVDDAADSARGVRTDVSFGRHAVVRNDNGQYAVWPGDLTVPGGW